VFLNIAVVHTSFRPIGGAERVCANVIEALNSVGIIPILFLLENVELLKLEKSYGKKISANIRVPRTLKIKRMELYDGLYDGAFYKMGIPVKDYDLVIDTSTIFMPYLCSPKRLLFYANNVLPKKDVFQARGLRKLYGMPYNFLFNRWIDKLESGTVVANSEFTKNTLKLYFKKNDIAVVYPPVSTSTFECQVEDTREGVISIGRFDAAKNHMMQLDIALKLPFLKFRICGSIYDANIFSAVKAKSEALNLKNVEFFTNLSLGKLVDLIHQSKYYIHTTEREAFGLTACEAIIGGCIPVVHNSGGMKEIVQQNDLRFDSMQDAVQILKHLEEGQIVPNMKVLHSHVEQFDEGVFREKLLHTIGLAK
jgi:glycosyltransferase involved in cell wall biosynthesis